MREEEQLCTKLFFFRFCSGGGVKPTVKTKILVAEENELVKINNHSDMFRSVFSSNFGMRNFKKMIISVLDPDAEITACDIETREKTMVQAI